MDAARRRSALFTVALFGAIALAGGLGGYVYSHAPDRDTLVVQVDRTPPESSGDRLVPGVMIDALTVDADGQVLTLPAGTHVDDLTRAEGGLPDGVAVNVGVERTEFGQVLTGIVAVQETP
ncbi:MAG: hypothetical protein O2798_05130 [Chloroflexi bacterium]|nr:hypothetical protein [Chloroflexota bacterium]MDA1240211.1 hypothetical protein [Chloroflexota bacterium]MQC47825.1 hypothetical protein [Chloroflexota bacterium]